MTYTYNHLPNDTYRNQDWTLVGASTAHDCVNNDDDAKYIKCPAHVGRCQITLPIDITSIPDGAVITSVTVFCRAKRNGSTPRALTCQIGAKDGKDRYMSRTIYPSDTITTYEIATYKKDPMGFSWDIHRCNKIILRVHCPDRVFDGCRCYKFWCRINYEIRASVVINAPTGTVYTPSPTIQWTYTHVDGEPQLKTEIKIFTALEVAKSNFNPDRSPPVFSTTVLGDEDTLILPTAINPDIYYTYVRVWTIHGCRSTWIGKQFTVSGPAPSPPGNDNAGLAGTPGVGHIAITPNSYESNNKLLLRDASNLLTVQQADFEEENEYLGYTTSNCTIARDITKFYPGGGKASMKMTASSAATMTAIGTYTEIAPSTPITISAQFLTAVTARSCSVVARYFDESFVQVGSDLTGTATDATGTWTQVTATGTTHASASWVQVRLVVTSPANAEVHYVDHVGIMYGTNSGWSNGGFASRNVLNAYLSTGEDPNPGGTQWTNANAATTVSRVTTSGTGSHGDKTNQMNWVGITPTIAFRAASTVYTNATSGTNFTLNKPAGLADNDLMIAFVMSNEHGGINPPAGWTAVNTASIDDGTTDTALWVLKRTGLAADPSTWTDGTVTVTSVRRTAVVMAYSGCDLASNQFLAEGTNTTPLGSLNHTSATVNNSDSNAWRISAFAFNDDASGGTVTANINPPSNTNISFVGTGSTWTSTSSTSSFTINRPSGVVQNDLMVASVCAYSKDLGAATVTVPSGWTLIRQSAVNDGTGKYVIFAVMRKIAGASEASSYSGTFSAALKPVTAGCTAYRNVNTSTPFIAENIATDTNDRSMNTATITNTSSNAWRIVSWGACTSSDSRSSSSEYTERYDIATDVSNYNDPLLATYDSNGPVSTGSHYRSVNTSDNQNYIAATAWIGLINPTASPPSVPNETERLDNTLGAADPRMTLAVYDSGAVVPIGNTSVTAVFTPGSGTEVASSASWIGMIAPASPVVSGEVAATTSTTIDISSIDPTVFTLCDYKMTFVASFLGSTAGTPYFTLQCYRANQLLTTQTDEGASYGTSIWSKSYVVFDIADGTTHVKPIIKSPGRETSGTLKFDRIGLMLGDSPVWRNGTGRTAHSVWSIPQIQVADDPGTGYGAWTPLLGQSTNTADFDALDGSVKYFDHTVIPLVNRKYRAQTLSYGLNGDIFVSGYGPASDESSLESTHWWLKDIKDPTNNLIIKVKAEPLSVGTVNTATAFQPLGEDYPIVVTEGYKSDAFDITIFAKREEYAQIVKMLKSGRTLYLQSNLDNAWWVRPVGDIDSDTLVTSQRGVDPLREVTLSFVQVAPEE